MTRGKLYNKPADYPDGGSQGDLKMQKHVFPIIAVIVFYLIAWSFTNAVIMKGREKSEIKKRNRSILSGFIVFLTTYILVALLRG